MYTEDDIKEFKKETEELLKLNPDTMDLEHASNAATQLHDVISFHDYRYYVQAEPSISDFDYDKLFKALKALEYKYPQLISPDSPTQRVALGFTKEFPVVNHLVPMLSLDNSYDEDDLNDFDRKVKDLAKTDQVTYSVEPKLDGTGISLVYENDRLVRGVTRGDGVMGEDVTPNIKVMKSVPLKAAFSKYGIHTIEIRGEVMIRKQAFEEYNKKREEEGLERLANPRNAAAGSIRMQDASEVAKRNLEAILYHVSYAVDEQGNDLLGEKLKSHSECIEMLYKLGFKAPEKEQKSFPAIKGAVDYVEKWAREREDYAYEIDGMVVKVDDLHLQEKLGSTSHHPRWAMAFKFKARQARTKLLNVEFQVGRVGNITPVAKLAPVPIGGVTVSSASMFNEDFIKAKDIRIGDDVLVERAGDVIPYIAGVVMEARTGDETPVQFPRECPSCGSDLVREEEEAAWRCVNSLCPEQVYWRLVHFVSKDAMDISGLGKANIDRFMKQGWLRTIPDIYRLPYEEMKKMEGLGEKSVQKLRDSIESSKNCSTHRLMFGLGIRYVGETTARNLADAVSCIQDLKEWSFEQLNDLYDVGEKVAQSIYDYFHTEENIRMIEELQSYGVNTCRQEKASADGGALEGITFLFTGTMERYTRPEAKELVENAGGKVASALSSKVDYLVVGADPGSKVDKAKKLQTVKIIDEERFAQLLNSGQN